MGGDDVQVDDAYAYILARTQARTHTRAHTHTHTHTHTSHILATR